MYVCQNCNFESEKQINFCPQCGSEVIKETVPVAEAVVSKAAAPAETAPVANVHTAPVQPTPEIYTEPPVVKKPNLAKKIVGMALSIEGFAGSIVAALYGFIGLLADAIIMGSAQAPAGVGFLMIFYFAIFTLPFSIVGLVFSNEARSLGDTSAFSRVGRALGIAGIIIIAAAMALGFMVMAFSATVAR